MDCEFYCFIITYLFENNLLAPISCDGEPAPERVLLVIFPAVKPAPNGDLKAPGSVGEVFAVDGPEAGR
jgi:hypothetical protein